MRTDSGPWRVLIIDDDEEIVGLATEELLEKVKARGMGPVEILHAATFDGGMKILESQNIDVAVLDVMLKAPDGPASPPDTAGRTIYEAIRARQFLPIVFWTSNPGLVDGLASSLVRVVRKTESDDLADAVFAQIETGLPRLDRVVRDHVASVQRDYLWRFADLHWDAFKENPSTLAYLLRQRISLSLRHGQWPAGAVGEDESNPEEYLLPAQRMYIMPPLAGAPQLGTVYEGLVDGLDGYWVLLSPSCDMVPGRVKIDRAILALARPLHEVNEHVEYAASQTRSKKRLLEKLIKNNRESQPDRYYYCPRCFELPDLLVDLADLHGHPMASLEKLKPVATLDSPYAEEVLARMGRYFGRVGTPDLDVAAIIARIEIELAGE